MNCLLAAEYWHFFDLRPSRLLRGCSVADVSSTDAVDYAKLVLQCDFRLSNGSHPVVNSGSRKMFFSVLVPSVLVPAQVLRFCSGPHVSRTPPPELDTLQDPKPSAVQHTPETLARGEGEDGHSLSFLCLMLNPKP